MFFSIWCIFVVFVGVASQGEQHSILRIYPNLAEVIQLVDKLPLEFTSDDWNNIRPQSIVLLGENLTMTSQAITEKKKSSNGVEVYIRSPISMDKNAVMFMKATLVDENRYLVKIQDQSVSAKEVLYFTVSPQDIFYIDQPSESKFYVDFTYDTTDSRVFVSYLRTNLNWQAQYQLNLYHDRSDLIAMANIRNNAKSSIVVDQAELISGDINFLRQSAQYHSSRNMMAQPMSSDQNGYMSGSSMPTAGSSEELAGVQVFPIDKPFVIDGQTNYLLPIFRPHVTVERYDSISSTFSSSSHTGKAQRSYRLTSDRYLSQGNCIIRELDRIVGEVFLPNIAAKDKYEFSVGQDADVIYTENVTKLPQEQFQEPEGQTSTNADNKTRSVYQIDFQVKNFKAHAMTVEYTQLFYINNLKLTSSTNNLCVQDSSSIKCKLALDANDKQVYSYTVQWIGL